MTRLPPVQPVVYGNWTTVLIWDAIFPPPTCWCCKCLRCWRKKGGVTGLVSGQVLFLVWMFCCRQYFSLRLNSPAQKMWNMPAAPEFLTEADNQTKRNLTLPHIFQMEAKTYPRHKLLCAPHREEPRRCPATKPLFICCFEERGFRPSHFSEILILFFIIKSVQRRKATEHVFTS